MTLAMSLCRLDAAKRITWTSTRGSGCYPRDSAVKRLTMVDPLSIPLLCDHGLSLADAPRPESSFFKGLGVSNHKSHIHIYTYIYIYI